MMQKTEITFKNLLGFKTFINFKKASSQKPFCDFNINKPDYTCLWEFEGKPVNKFWYCKEDNVLYRASYKWGELWGNIWLLDNEFPDEAYPNPELGWCYLKDIKILKY